MWRVVLTSPNRSFCFVSSLLRLLLTSLFTSVLHHHYYHHPHHHQEYIVVYSLQTYVEGQVLLFTSIIIIIIIKNIIMIMARMLENACLQQDPVFISLLLWSCKTDSGFGIIIDLFYSLLHYRPC